MRPYKLLACLILLFCFQLSFFFPNVTLAAWYCAYEDSINWGKCDFLRPSIDTTRILAIYCTPHLADDTLPTYWSIVWDTTYQLSIPRFFKDNSKGKYLLYCDPKVDTINGRPSPFRHPSLYPNGDKCAGGGTAFAESIFIKVDSVVNFANYDQDQDRIVDGFVFIVVNATTYSDWVCPCLGDFSYKTHDTNAYGDTIQVLGERGIEIPMNGSESLSDTARFMQECIHTWGHQFGLPDLFLSRWSGYG